MKKYLNLIRFPNLIIIALTMYVMRYFILRPILSVNHFMLQLPGTDFLLLVLSVVSMAAAGYIINDYFDTKSDRLNSRVVIVGRTVPRRVSLLLHTLFNIAAILLGIYASWRIGYWEFGVIFIMASGLLWFYSTSYKYYFLTGSVIIALLVAAIPFLVVVFEVPMLNKIYGEIVKQSQANFNHLVYWVGAFSFFAFIAMLISQFLRDMDALKGDREINRRSLPLVLGLKGAKIVIISLTTILSIALIVIWYKFLNTPIDIITPWYFGGLIILPLIWLSILVARFETSKNIRPCKLLLKWVMLAGISYSFVVYYIIS